MHGQQICAPQKGKRKEGIFRVDDQLITFFRIKPNSVFHGQFLKETITSRCYFPGHIRRSSIGSPLDGI